MIFGIPQLIMLVLSSGTIFFELARHGHERTVKHNVFTTLLAVALQQLILWWGGFYG